MRTSLNPGRAGRPQNITIAPEDAKILRDAVKLTAKYFGIRLQDLGDPSWMAAAMRKKAPMSVETAFELLDIITHPKPELVARKRPQGSSTAMVMRTLLEKSADAESRGDQDYEWAKEDVAAQYFAFCNFAGLIMMKYKMPLPGTAVFVMPGTSRLVASMLTSLLPLDTLGKKHRREVTETLERYFELGEKPFATVLGKEIVPRLTYASLAENLRETAKTLKADGWQPEHLDSLERWARDLRDSERRRRRARKAPVSASGSQAKIDARRSKT
jgi:hypothetical protein